MQQSVAYLGYIITPEELNIDPKKIEAINKFPRPRNVKEIQSFMGMCNYYRRYVQNYAQIAKPLYDLCKKNVAYEWTIDCEQAFISFKRILTSPPLLSYPNFKEPFILHTDASDVVIGAILSQGELPRDKLICYFSQTLSPAESRYSTIEKELTAVIKATQKHAHYLKGRKFTIVTDHRPLTYLFNTKNMNARLHRWRHIISSHFRKFNHYK